MSRLLLAAVAAFGVLAAGCTKDAPAPDVANPPAPATEAAPPSSDEPDLPTVADIKVGQAAWVLSTAAFPDPPDGCISLNTDEDAIVTTTVPADVANPGWYNGLLVERPNAASLLLSWKLSPGRMTRTYRLSVYRNADTDVMQPPAWTTPQCPK
jgi:hypothetical protein